MDADTERDWRLRADVKDGHRPGLLGRLASGLREPGVAGDLARVVPHDVVVTHDGASIFAYAAGEPAIGAVRSSLEALLGQHGERAEIVVSHWDEEIEDWQQIDPPPAERERARSSAQLAAARELQTRTFVASSGRLVRSEFEQTMLSWADRLGLQCSLVESPHLLTTQVAFTVSGPARHIDEFASGLRAEGLAMTRTELGVMASPL